MSAAFRIVIVAPVFRDWESASILARRLDEAFAGVPADVRLLFVDDGSPDGLAGWEPFTPRRLSAIDALRLKRNLGHQGAIATALCHVQARVPCDGVVVMDADGEDRPDDAATLARALVEDPSRIVFARRRRRRERAWFRAGYQAYRLLHRALTGVPVRMGNFSALPASALTRLTCMPELWSHYVGAVFRSRMPFTAVPMDRGVRYRGASRLDVVAMVTHGLSGIATFQDVVATRLLLFAAAAMGAVLAGLAVVVGIRLGTNLAIPGWATTAAGFLLVLLSLGLATAVSTAFLLMSTRTAASFVPSRDAAVFIEGVTELARP